jgi:D-tyrosyl-tRNA(Tyr) deacylase
MRLLIQRCLEASVDIAGQRQAGIGRGLLVLVGIEHEDTQGDAQWMAAKLVGMRLFADEAGKMNCSLREVNGELLVVSQFTLHAQCAKGNRPSFIRAARPEVAIPLYEFFLQELETLLGQPVPRGVFGADMQVALINDGPVTIWLDSRDRQ